MNGVREVLEAGGPLIGVVVGAGLTYLFNARSRKHQEEREDRTRWYGTRVEAYADLSRAFSNSLMYMTRGSGSEQEQREIAQGFSYAVGLIRIVGSDEAKLTAGRLFRVVTDETAKGFNADPYGKHLGATLEAFEAAARADLGFPAIPRMKRFAWLPWRRGGM
jgi:hypothetical protein